MLPPLHDIHCLHTHTLTNMFFPNDSICKFSNSPNDCISLQTHLCPSFRHSISLSSNHTSSGTSNKAFLNYCSHTQVVDAAPHRAREHAVLQTGVTFGYATGCVCMFVCTYEERCVFFHKFAIYYDFIYNRQIQFKM